MATYISVTPLEDFFFIMVSFFFFFPELLYKKVELEGSRLFKVPHITYNLLTSDGLLLYLIFHRHVHADCSSKLDNFISLPYEKP